MQLASYRLESAWHTQDGPHGRFVFSLFNLSDTAIHGFTIVYTSLTRLIDKTACENAVFVCFNVAGRSSTELRSSVSKLLLQSIDNRSVHLADP